MIPFGALVDFKPTPAKAQMLQKFAPTSVPGIFLGYHLQPGGKWKGDYFVIPLTELQSSEDTAPKAQRVKEVYLATGAIQFPMKQAYDAKTRSVTVNKDEIEKVLPPEIEKDTPAGDDNDDADSMDAQRGDQPQA